MRDRLRDLYLDRPPLMDPGASLVTPDYCACCCKAACQSTSLLYLEEDVTTAVSNAPRFGGGLGSGVCVCGRKSKRHPETGLQRSHGPRGGGDAGGDIPEREAEVVLQVWEQWFLKFDLPLRTLGTPMWPHVQWPRSCPRTAPHPFPCTLSSPIHGLRHDGGVDAKNDAKNDRQSGMCLCVCFCLPRHQIFCPHFSFKFE